MKEKDQILNNTIDSLSKTDDKASMKVGEVGKLQDMEIRQLANLSGDPTATDDPTNNLAQAKQQWTNMSDADKKRFSVNADAALKSGVEGMDGNAIQFLHEAANYGKTGSTQTASADASAQAAAATAAASSTVDSNGRDASGRDPAVTEFLNRKGPTQKYKNTGKPYEMAPPPKPGGNA